MGVVRTRFLACHLSIPRDGAKRLRQRLPKAAPINGRHIRSLYVGVLAITGQLVYISSKKGEVYPNLFEDDDFTSLAFKAEPSQTPAGSNTILIETNLIGGNLARNKKYVTGQTDSFDSEADPEGKTIRQNEKVHQYLPPRSFSIPTSTARRGSLI
ncbi:hypothetical protein FOTG_14262 [Fusarium oxysporum f. sp. vasinfectum 25433]|uniref:Uncharacterized protein n=1 Tax=Fusarium oxysporum f. sp. vasinfectum 25433 TaxID=1089449 RepID=X0L994_FUSOX|nr:hypothetical protein FOTG_14262 [Fusarium oxysporum f. sp. vasinfectum 25433]